MKPKAILLLLIVLTALVAVVLTIKPVQSPKTVRVGAMAEDFELFDPGQNRTISLSNMRGSVVFVNFWATWCTSCIDELPSIEQMYKTFADNDSFRVVTILYKDDLSRALNFMHRNGFTFPVYLNSDESAARQFGITGIPETFIIDKRGYLRNRVIGPAEWDSPRVIEIFYALLNEP